MIGGGTIDQARRALTARFAAAGIDTPDLDARLLLGHALGLDLTGLVRQAMRALTDQDACRLEAFANRRLAHEPVARIVGHKEFWGLPLRLSPDTLVPRSDTETIIEAALAMIEKTRTPLRIVDLGTGSGAILLALLSEYPNAIGIGTDISINALVTAQRNAGDLALTERAAFVACDYAAALTGPFDLIVSNPPYIRSADIAALDIEVRDHDPMRALDGGTDGYDAYRVIAREAARLLTPDGLVLVEVGHHQSDDVQAILMGAGLPPPRPPICDLAGIPRVVSGRNPSL
ncbi:MAG: modification methylase, HemK family [Tardiphaga sp.]|nr:modification methylase, HemK family [Tardiphaga sp.]